METPTPAQQLDRFPDRLQDLPPDTPRAVQALTWMRPTVIVCSVFLAGMVVVRLALGKVPNPETTWGVLGGVILFTGGLVFLELRARRNRMSFVAGATSYAIYRGDRLGEVVPRDRITCYRLSLYNTFLFGFGLAFLPPLVLVYGISKWDWTLIITGLISGVLAASFFYKRIICRWIIIGGGFFEKQIALHRKGSDLFS